VNVDEAHRDALCTAGLQVFRVVVQTGVACLSAPRVSTYCYPEFHVGEVFRGDETHGTPMVPVAQQRCGTIALQGKSAIGRQVRIGDRQTV